MSNQNEINKSISKLKQQFPTTTFETALYCDSITKEISRYCCFWPKRLKKLKQEVDDLGYVTRNSKFENEFVIYKNGTNILKVQLSYLAKCRRRVVSIHEDADLKLVEFLKMKYKRFHSVVHYQASCSVFTGNKQVPIVNDVPTCPECGGTVFVRALL